MFDSIGWGEILVLGLAALFIFGPERLPTLARDAAQGIKRVREAMTGVRGQLHDSLGEDFDQLRDLDLRQYNPRTFLRTQLLGDDDAPTVHRESGPGVTTSRASTGATAASAAARRDPGVPPPFDLDAT